MNDRSPFELDAPLAEKWGDDPYVDLDLDPIQPSVWLQVFSLIVSGLCITATGILFGLVRVEPHPCALFFAMIFTGPTLWIAGLQWMAVFRCRPVAAMIVASVAYTICAMVAFQCVLLCCDLDRMVNRTLLPPYAFVALITGCIGATNHRWAKRLRSTCTPYGELTRRFSLKDIVVMTAAVACFVAGYQSQAV